MFIQSEDGGADSVERCVICTHGGAHSVRRLESLKKPPLRRVRPARLQRENSEAGLAEEWTQT